MSDDFPPQANVSTRIRRNPVTKRPPFRQTEEQQLEQIRALSSAEKFAFSITRNGAIALIATNEARLDLNMKRLYVCFDLGDQR